MHAQFSFIRFLVFVVVGLPVGFILTAFGFAVSGMPILAHTIFPWAIGIAIVIGVLGGLWKQEH
jgi:hypothetical protein